MNATITNRYEVTEAQLQRTHRIADLNNHRVFYHVESATEPFETYTVQYNPVVKAITCTCKAGQEGFKNAPQKCWHVRASIQDAKEYRQAQIEEQEADMISLSDEIATESRHYGAYTVQVDPTSSSLDGVTFEVRNGKAIPMR